MKTFTIRHLFKFKPVIIGILAILTLLVCYTLPCYADWQKSDIGFAFAEQERLIIGDGRDDGIMRVYTGDGTGCDGNIYEFSYAGAQWGKVSFSADLCHITGLDIGTGRNDGKNRVYASGYNLAEYYYSSGSWLGGEIGPYIQWTNDLVLGDARNDGKVRIYVAEWDGIIELTYNNGSWNTMEIDTGGQGVDKLLITDGRNDGILRLYAAIDDHVYEYTWTGSAWQINDCGASGAIAFYDMVAGEGRNDGINRIYLAANWGGIYELSYNGGSWQYIVVANPAPMGYVGTVAVGNGRNDGMNRVYAEYSPSYGENYLAEYTYSGTWSKTSDIDSGLGVNDIAIGNGRNDGTNRVYVTGDDNHIYEYSFTTSRFEENDPAITYTGTWNNYTCTSCSGGALKYSGQTGAKATFNFNGTGIKWIVTRAPMLGKAKVYLDGSYLGMVDLYNLTAQWQLVLQKTGLAAGSHTLRLDVSGQKNESSTGYYIDVDAFEVIP